MTRRFGHRRPGQRRSHGTSILAATCAALALIAVISASPVSAAMSAKTGLSLDQRSDHTALIAYRGYLDALIDAAGQGRSDDGALVTKIESVCPDALSMLNTLSASQVSSSALSDLGEEIGGDLALDFLSEARAPFRRLSSTLSGLRWSHAASAATVAGLLSAESGVLGLTPGHLCVAARAIALHPKRTPAAMASFLTRYLGESAALKRHLGALLALLGQLRPPGDMSLITAIDGLVDRFNTLAASAQKTDADQILSDLGLSTS